MLAQVSAIEEQVVEALLSEPVIAALVEEYGRMLEMSDEEFRARLRPVVRMVVEHEVRKPKPKGPFLFFLFFCLDIRGDDPVQEIIKALLSSLRKKREMSRRARAAAVPPPIPPSHNPDRRVEPTEKELLAESMVRFANRGRRFLALKIAEELADRVEAGLIRPTSKLAPVIAKENRPTEKVIEGCGDRVDPHICVSTSSSYPDKRPQGP